MIPVEINRTIKRWVFVLREGGYVNSSSLSEFYKNEHSVMIFLEIGYKL